LLQIALALREERALLQFRDYLRPTAGITATAAGGTASAGSGSSNSQGYASYTNKQQQCVVVVIVSVPRQQLRQQYDQRSQR
jgi:hypothetical protein